MRTPETSQFTTGAKSADRRTAPPHLSDRKKDHKLKGTMLKIAAVAAVLGGSAGVAEVLINPPAIFKSVDNGQGVPDFFDPTAKSGVIGLNNTKPVTNEEIQQLPSFDENKKPLLLFPISNLPAGSQIAYEKQLDNISQIQNPELEKEIRSELVLPAVRAGSTFVTSESGKLLIMAVVRNGKTIKIGARLEFMSPDNTLWTLSFATDGIGSKIIETMDFLVDAPVVVLGEPGDWPEGKTSARNTNISQVLVDNPMRFLLMGVTPDGKHIPGDIRFLMDPSQPKLLIANK